MRQNPVAPLLCCVLSLCFAPNGGRLFASPGKGLDVGGGALFSLTSLPQLETGLQPGWNAIALPLTGFLMFGLLSVPMGLLQDRKGKKFVLLLGLSVALAGALLPIAAGMYGRQVVIEAGDLTKFYVVLASWLPSPFRAVWCRAMHSHPIISIIGIFGWSTPRTPRWKESYPPA